MNAPIDLTGQKFGRLLVLEKAKIRQGHTHWRCLCDCGNETFVESYQQTLTKEEFQDVVIKNKNNARTLSGSLKLKMKRVKYDYFC